MVLEYKNWLETFRELRGKTAKERINFQTDSATLISKLTEMEKMKREIEIITEGFFMAVKIPHYPIIKTGCLHWATRVTPSR